MDDKRDVDGHHNPVVDISFAYPANYSAAFQAPIGACDLGDNDVLVAYVLASWVVWVVGDGDRPHYNHDFDKQLGHGEVGAASP